MLPLNLFQAISFNLLSLTHTKQGYINKFLFIVSLTIIVFFKKHLYHTYISRYITPTYRYLLVNIYKYEVKIFICVDNMFIIIFSGKQES